LLSPLSLISLGARRRGVTAHFKRLADFTSSPGGKTVGSVLVVVASAWFWAAVVAMFFTRRYPALDPFVRGTFLVYFGVLAGGIACLMLIGPGVVMGKDLFEGLHVPGDSKWARRFTLIWCGGAGALLSLLLGTAFALIATGVLSEVKLWFIGVCWTVLLVPWALLGLAGRWLFRRRSRRGGPRTTGTPLNRTGA
jgi:hypothetical protein